MRVTSSTYLTLVDAAQGMHSADEPKSVTLALVTDEVKGWYDYLFVTGVSMHKGYTPKPGRNHDGFVALDPAASYTPLMLPPIITTMYLPDFTSC